jgi:hypothetical protein
VLLRRLGVGGHGDASLHQGSFVHLHLALDLAKSEGPEAALLPLFHDFGAMGSAPRVIQQLRDGPVRDGKLLGRRFGEGKACIKERAASGDALVVFAVVLEAPARVVEHVPTRYRNREGVEVLRVRKRS